MSLQSLKSTMYSQNILHSRRYLYTCNYVQHTHWHTGTLMHVCVHMQYAHAIASCEVLLWYTYVILGNPPVISTHPMDASVLLWYGNESVVFTCDANGGKNIEYTWHTETSNGSMVMGEKSNTLILNSVIVDMNNTQYYCIASNESGSDRSNSALLTVNGEL